MKMNHFTLRNNAFKSLRSLLGRLDSYSGPSSLSSAVTPDPTSSTPSCALQSKLLLAGHTLAYKYLGPAVPYQTALAIQQATLAHRQSLARHVPNVMYLVQHDPPVYTAGRRIKGTDATEGERLRKLGAQYFEIQRGGEVTFHGPGQIVGYPVVNLKELGISVRCYVSLLERGIIRLCKDHYGLDAGTSPHTGVWVGDNKIAALGVHVSRYVTMHGFALNVTTNLDWYKHIVPCGITDKGVTSIANELQKGRASPEDAGVSEEQVMPKLRQAFASEWGVKWEKLEDAWPEWNEEVERMLKI
ncbi:hypothetical protein BCR44DRAFT_1329724 [Catenaria anguillulae PL171]|uniref:lipoyl(octanoyl) transferase n=1 Tax=Catenaria anguillulae PL171 TaxID=765915 RepID=A0A1Y2H8Y4_9FUNG|nr:hypothetical protein BCR44DRAFT_1329724 [Catenaria anguillulae PL171]